MNISNLRIPGRAGLPATIAFALLCSAAMPGGAARADGMFLQFDAAPEAGSAVLSVERGKLTFGATHVFHEDGTATGAAALFRFTTAPTDAPVSVKIGPSIGLINDEEEGADAQVGLRIVGDRYAATGFGGVYGLAEVDTIDSAWFVMGQAILADTGLTIELSRGASDTYSETTLATSKRLDGSPMSLRGGYRFGDESWFAGISINTF